MKPSVPLSTLALALALLAPAAASALDLNRPGMRASALAADSLYRLPAVLTDSHGKRFEWREHAGRPLLVTMFYGDCNTACPIVLENLVRTSAALKQDGKLAILMVSLDPLHDTPAALDQLAHNHHLDPAVFRLAVAGSETQTRALAGVLNIKFRAMSGGAISHTTRIGLLDREGRLLASSSELSAQPDPAFLDQVRLALRAH